MSWIVKAEGGTRAADRDEIRRALSILIDPGQTFELRGLPSGRSRVCRGGDLEAATEAAWDLSDGHGVYFTLNPCHADLSKAASNADILSRRWLLVDCDPVKPGLDVQKLHAPCWLRVNATKNGLMLLLYQLESVYSRPGTTAGAHSPLSCRCRSLRSPLV